jgi:predicted ATPase
MPISNEIRRLSAKWSTGTGWPKRLEWLEIKGLRGWAGQRFDFQYPIMAVVGENGVGKSTVLQAAASVYKLPKGAKKGKFASDFFPKTTWENVKNASVVYSVREGGRITESSLRKPGERWRGNPQRPERYVSYVDLSRIQPVAARPGYTKLVKSHHIEVSAMTFDASRLGRFCQIMGRPYDLAKLAITNIHARRPVPVLSQQGATYSGFHQGAGETTILELLDSEMLQYGIVLIDEIESSLHPRLQRRLIRELAERCREREMQVVLTTHSPYVLAELPPEARAYIMVAGNEREIIYGVSPEFAMTKMDDVAQPECDLYVEDIRSQMLLTEILVAHAVAAVQRCRIIPYGASSVGKALGQMLERRCFPRPSRVFLDGDQAFAPGCVNFPGEDAPERVVFESLKCVQWQGIAERVGRPFSDLADACERSMFLADHHDWVNEAANKLTIRGDFLWHAMCAEWAKNLSRDEVAVVVQTVEDALIGVNLPSTQAPAPVLAPVAPRIAAIQEGTAPEKAKPSHVAPLPLLNGVPEIPIE